MGRAISCGNSSVVHGQAYYFFKNFSIFGAKNDPRPSCFAAFLKERLVELARKKPRFGYRRLHLYLDKIAPHVNHKRVFRVYRAAGLAVRRKARKRLVREGSPRPALTAANQAWAVDFVHDAVASGRAIRVLSMVDEYTRECLTLEVDTSFASRRVTRALENLLR